MHTNLQLSPCHGFFKLYSKFDEGPFIPDEQPLTDSSSSSSSSASDDEPDKAIQQNNQAIQMLQDDEDYEYMEHFHNVVAPQAVQHLYSVQQLSNPPKKKRGGSKVGRQYIYRDHVAALERLELNYFHDIHTFSESQFRNRYRVPRSIFERVYAALCTHPLFVQKVNAIGKLGVHAKIKTTVALRFLGYGSASDALDEIFCLGNHTALNALDEFCIAMNQLFGKDYLRAPNNADVSRILADAEKRGWHGCLGSIECTTWEWKNCPVEWIGQFVGKEKFPSVVLEAARSHDGWIWHSFFGPPGDFNDRTILQMSHLLHPFCSGQLAPVHYTVNSNPYNVGYYLVDGIYPKWACLVSAKKDPIDVVEAHFTKCQEATHKDIKCAFGRLKGKWHILQRPSRFHCLKVMTRIMYTCFILHNTVIHSRCTNKERDYIPDAEPPPVSYEVDSQEWKMTYAYARNEGIGASLVADLIHHHWSRRNV